MSQPEPTCYRHAERVAYVSCTRCGRHICGDCQIPASVGFHCPDDVKDANKGVRQPRTAYGGRRPQVGQDAQVTRALVGINVAVFVITLLGGASLVLGGGDSPLYRLFAMQPVALSEPGGGVTRGIADGEYYRLLTAAFLHYGTLHLLLNMFALVSLGPELERALGRGRFLALYLLCGIAGNAASYALGPEFTRAAGASGAIYGLAGAWLVLSRRRKEDLGPIVGFLALGFAITFLPDLNIDWRAHLGGFVAGALLGAALFLPSRRSAEERALADKVQAVGAGIVVLVVVGVVAARTLVLT